MNQTRLMPEPEHHEDMPWEEAVQRVDHAVHQWLSIIRDYGGEDFSQDSENLSAAWARILRG